MTKICKFCNTALEGKDATTHGRWGCTKAYAEITKAVAPQCACGCGEKVETSKRNPRKFNKYLRGHNKRKIHSKLVKS